MDGHTHPCGLLCNDWSYLRVGPDQALLVWSARRGDFRYHCPRNGGPLPVGPFHSYGEHGEAGFGRVSRELSRGNGGDL